MPGYTDTSKRVRKFILDRMLETGRAPNLGNMMRALGLSKTEVLNSLQELERGRCLHMEKGTENIRMFHPFANITTAYEIEVGGQRKWHGEGALESLAVCQLFPGKEVGIFSYCPHCAEPIEVWTKDGKILSRQPEGIVLHFGVPLARWFEDLLYAGNYMDFFSSEEHVTEWGKEHPNLKGDTITVEQGLAFITFVGARRLDYDYFTPSAEVPRLLKEIGLTNEFWRR